ncbi:hypothetical protein PHAVU_009G238600 [Phaseolus vulgaris]|uniref:Uncharacterized protein n=1 Tax=Phaseolus vulgaris TaxID=3885 RepID=V7B2V7_PHAVU|nr:hypothetical protein PHAVU_009G238600g [Phaseolus vulgaris]ESW10796.1 hypothetical protein PHAVU_009G238600g [Phaseolus vulgaris]
MVNWKVICKLKHGGDLGIKDLKFVNRVLMGKSVWSLCMEENELYIYILKSKYDEWCSLLDCKDGVDESLWWRDFRKVCNNKERGK